MNPQTPASLGSGSSSDPVVGHPLLAAYLAQLHARACAAGTVRNAKLYLGNLLRWLEDRHEPDLRKVTRALLETYQCVLSTQRKRDGHLLAVAGQHVRLTTIQGFFRWLARQQHLAANPAADLELPRLGRRLPRAVLTAPEVERVLAMPKEGTISGLRDRAILEVLYSTGIRRSELCQLRLDDLDFARGSVLIREGKGRKDRIIPLGRRAGLWLQRYLDDARPQMLELSSGPQHTVFLGCGGKGLSSGVLGQLVHGYVERSKIGKSGSCHLFRHAMATLMLEGGADIRYIQHILGHARLPPSGSYRSLRSNWSCGAEDRGYGTSMSPLLARVTFNPNQCGGRPCIRGMRIRVKDVLDLLAAGVPEAQILRDYPDLEPDDIKASLEYAAAQLDHPVLTLASR